jgi:hypothetical protein
MILIRPLLKASVRVGCMLAISFSLISFAATQTWVQPPTDIIAWRPLDETSGTTAQDIVRSQQRVHGNGVVPAQGGTDAMPDPQREFLVILEPRLADKTLAQLRAIANVTQVLAPRLALVRADPETMARAAQIGGVLDVSDDTLPELPQDLSPSERLFVSAWEARRQPKTRPGEGLSWDAPGFLPPDPPVDRR